jgi:hypothetical protein
MFFFDLLVDEPGHLLGRRAARQQVLAVQVGLAPDDQADRRLPLFE